jgi:hypothetical protein
LGIVCNSHCLNASGLKRRARLLLTQYLDKIKPDGLVHVAELVTPDKVWFIKRWPLF